MKKWDSYLLVEFVYSSRPSKPTSNCAHRFATYPYTDAHWLSGSACAFMEVSLTGCLFFLVAVTTDPGSGLCTERERIQVPVSVVFVCFAC
jgi:hypothetical protein